MWRFNVNKNQEVLIFLLKSVLQNNKILDYDFKDVDWQYIFAEAKAHEVHSLIYSTIKNLDINDNQYKQTISQWKNTVIQSTFHQIRHINQVNRLLLEFKESGIPAIPLKGLVLRNYYPIPEQRTMIDADILVKIRDVEGAKAVLLKMGYKEYSNNPIHINYIHQHHFPIELHWNLINRKYLNKDTTKFEERIWESVVPAVICGVEVSVLSLEGMLLHMFLHMAVHTVCSGFGLRQLVDCIYFVNHNADNINWELFSTKVKECGIEKFVQIAFKLCNYLFDFKLTKYVWKDIEYGNDLYQSFIEDILSAGSHGQKDKVRQVATQKLNDIGVLEYKALRDKQHVMYYYINLLFPPVKDLGQNYTYAKIHPILLPMAWLHRFFRALFHKGFTAKDKKAMLFSSSSVYKRRLILLQWLDLQ